MENNGQQWEKKEKMGKNGENGKKWKEKMEKMEKMGKKWEKWKKWTFSAQKKIARCYYFCVLHLLLCVSASFKMGVCKDLVNAGAFDSNRSLTEYFFENFRSFERNKKSLKILKDMASAKSTSSKTISPAKPLLEKCTEWKCRLCKVSKLITQVDDSGDSNTFQHLETNAHVDQVRDLLILLSSLKCL